MNKEIIGIITSTVDYKESSLIINVLTKDGFVGIIAQGCKRINSPFKNQVSKMTYAKFNVVYKKDKLSILKEVNVINKFKNIYKDFETLSYGAYFLNLVEQVSRNIEDSLLDLLICSLEKLDLKINPLFICNLLELKCLEYLGVKLVYECVKCKSKQVTSFSNDGLLCKSCSTQESNYAISLLKILLLIDIYNVSKCEADNKALKTISNFLSEYYTFYTGIYLNSKFYIDNALKYI